MTTDRASGPRTARAIRRTRRAIRTAADPACRVARAMTRRSPPGTRSSAGASKPGSISSSRRAARSTLRPAATGPSMEMPPSREKRRTLEEGIPGRSPRCARRVIALATVVASAACSRKPAAERSASEIVAVRRVHLAGLLATSLPPRFRRKPRPIWPEQKPTWAWKVSPHPRNDTLGGPDLGSAFYRDLQQLPELHRRTVQQCRLIFPVTGGIDQAVSYIGCSRARSAIETTRPCSSMTRSSNSRAPGHPADRARHGRHDPAG